MTHLPNQIFRDRLLMLFFRPRDGIYVIPHGIIPGGSYYLVEPFEHIPITASAERVWTAILKVFPGANRAVPQPKSWTEETAWYRKAGVKKWSEFAGKSRHILSVTETQTDYVFKLHDYQRGVVTSDKDTMIEISKQAASDDILAVLDSFLKQV
jgi:hypothetical protein